MSIAAVITDVSRNEDGTATLHLGPLGTDGPGQSRLEVLNPPAHLEAAIGCTIWGGDDKIIMGRETLWARRIGYTKIQLEKKAVTK